MPTDNVRNICTSHLPSGLDVDIIDYIVNMMEGEEEETEKREALEGFLLSCGVVESEDEATVQCRKLLDALAPLAAQAVDLSDPGLKVLSKATTMAALDGGEDAFREAGTELGGRLVSMDEALDSRKKRKAAEEAERRACKAAYLRIAVQRQEEEAALQAAMARAVTLRRKIGAFTGQIEAKPFPLPNPGGGTPLLENASFTLVRGRVYGLIGRNGKGKSTLLRALASRTVGNIPPEVTVHYVSQEVQLDEAMLLWTPVQFVVHADIERRMLLEEQAALSGRDAADDAEARRLVELQQMLENIEAETAQERATTLLTNLGFSAELRARPMNALSGGWRVRTALAAAIFAKPDLLLLDEPTNHLSIGAVLWLARELATNETWKQRIVAVVSHDRCFLDEITTDTLHISGAARQLTQSKGNYTTWTQRREQQQLTHGRAKASKEREIKDLRDFNPGMLGSTPKAMKIYKMKQKQAEKLEEELKNLEIEAAALQEDAEIPLSLKAGGELSGFVVQIKNVGFRYTPDLPFLFRGAEMGIDSKSRIVLLGENGNGKTTLVRLMLGDLEATEGIITHAGGVRIALVNQHHADQIDLTLSPLRFMLDKFPGDGSYEHEQAIRSHLSGCGVTSQLMTLPASALSGGQRSRVSLAAVSYTKPHVLVLDEPTNNLDLESVVALADCIERFEGGVVLVSHDQYFVGRVAKEVWVVDGGVVSKAESFDKYRAQALAKLK